MNTIKNSYKMIFFFRYIFIAPRSKLFNVIGPFNTLSFLHGVFSRVRITIKKKKKKPVRKTYPERNICLRLSSAKIIILSGDWTRIVLENESNKIKYERNLISDISYLAINYYIHGWKRTEIDPVKGSVPGKNTCYGTILAPCPLDIKQLFSIIFYFSVFQFSFISYSVTCLPRITNTTAVD